MTQKKERRLSVSQYAASIKISRQAIIWRIKKGKELPGVASFEKVGRAYVLTMID